MSQLVQLEGKYTTQNAHCAVMWLKVSSRSSQGRPVKNSPCQNFRFHTRLPKRFSSGNLERENIEFTSNLDMKGSSGNGFLRVGKFCHERFHLNCHPPNLWGTRFLAWLPLEVTLSTLADISAWIWSINKHPLVITLDCWPLGAKGDCPPWAQEGLHRISAISLLGRDPTW